MITYLKVCNLAIVEEFAIEPGAGLTRAAAIAVSLAVQLKSPMH